MTSSANNLKNTYSGRLAEFAGELRDHIDDEEMLQEIHEAIKGLLTGKGASEREIRRVLQQQHDHGLLREESFELVQKLIDRIVLDSTPAGDTDASVETADDHFSSTAVIPTVPLDPDEVHQQLQVGSVLRDRFLLQEEVSGGSMGKVFKALDRRLAEADSGDHWVAVKVLSPQLAYDGNALRALQQEAAKTRCLTHPNIVRFIDLDRDDELYFMVMEWLDGRTLAEVLDRKQSKKLDVATTLDIVRQLGQALEFAHQRGVVHADVKPGNVMITPDGKVKLFDFGIARIRQKQKDNASFNPGVLKAVSPAYSSMQVLTGEDPVPSDDVFSLACLAYRMIAGYRVFGPRDAAEAAAAGMKPQKLDGISRIQWKALSKALSFSRVTRFSSPVEFVDALTSDTDTLDDVSDTTETEIVRGSGVPWRILAISLIFMAAIAAVMQGDLIRMLGFETGPQSAETEAEEVIDTQGESGIVESGEESQLVLNDSELTGGVELQASPVAPADDTDYNLPVDEEGQEVSIPDPVVEYTVSSSDAEVPTIEDAGPTIENAPTGRPATAAIDWASLPPANATILIAGSGELPPATNLLVNEDAEPLIIDFLRESNLGETVLLQLVETSFTGSRSPLASGQYSISGDGSLHFPAGQQRARVTIEMSSDPVREQDLDVTLQVQDAGYSDINFATLAIRLADDDQRSFESGLATDTVSFAVSQVSVREGDSAVQVDVIRYKPGNTTLDVNYVIRDVTADEGDDYIDPGVNVLTFAPGQRTARILVPLVQDSSSESNEAFMLELQNVPRSAEGNIYQRIAVMIRDDDS